MTASTVTTPVESQDQLTSIEISVKGKWITVPALAVDDKRLWVRGRRIKSAVVYAEEWLESEVSDPSLCIKSLKEQKKGPLRADIFSFSQMLPHTLPKYDYPMEWQSVAATPTSSFKQWWENLPQTTRKNVRRSQKRDVVVSLRKLDDKLIEDIVDLNNDSPVRQRIPFSHYGKSFDQVKKDQSSYLDHSDFICAYVEDDLVGFLKLVHRGKVASILQLLPRASEQDRRPANALLAKAVEVCAAKGVEYLTYGQLNYGNKRDSPLRDFKIRNGFGEILVPRFHVPLTVWGAFCVKTKLNRGLVGILPHRVIAAGIKARAAWYSIKYKTGRCSSTSEHPNSNRQMGRSSPPAGSNS